MLKKDFLKAAKKAEGMSADAFVDAILAERPDLAGKPVYVPAQGICAYTVIIGDEVFKTARFNNRLAPEVREHFIRAIERERKILEHLKGKGLPVPEVTYTGKKFPFFGMTKMPGESFDRWDVAARKPHEKLRLAKEIAALNVKLSQALSEFEAKDMGVDVPFPNRDFQPDVLRSQLADPKVKKLLGKDYAFLKGGVEKYIEQHQKKYGDKLYFMHGDLLSGNIFSDPKTNKISALLDFGISCLTCPENGFLGFSKAYPEYFVDMVLEEYSRLQGVQVTRRDIQRWECVLLLGTAARAFRPDKSASWRSLVKDSISTFHAKAGDLSTDKPLVLPRKPAPETP